MDTPANKQLVRRFVADVFQSRKASAVDELVADDFVSHTWGSAASNKADKAMRQLGSA